MTNRFLRALTASALLLPMTAFAHPGHEASTFVQGFAHPLGGIDHLLAMIAVGILASRFEGSIRWHLPLAFIAAMTVGALAATVSVVVPSVELMIALSLVVFGAAIAVARAFPTTLSLAAVSTFAIFHGYAHGAEMIGSSLLSFGAGFVLSTALLHAGGLWISLRARAHGSRALTTIRIGGGLIAAVGAALMPL